MRSQPWSRMMLAVAFCASFLCVAASAADSDKKEAEGGKKTPPKVNKTYVERYRQSKDQTRKTIVSLHDEIQGYMDEIQTLKNVEDAKEKRKAERKIKSLESKIARQRRTLEKTVEKHLKSYRKVYEENKEKVETNKAKAEKLEAEGKADKATRYHQEGAKYSGAMESAKREIELTEYFLFFDEE